jgi:hypothetical protein
MRGKYQLEPGSMVTVQIPHQKLQPVKNKGHYCDESDSIAHRLPTKAKQAAKGTKQKD